LLAGSNYIERLSSSFGQISFYHQGSKLGSQFRFIVGAQVGANLYCGNQQAGTGLYSHVIQSLDKTGTLDQMEIKSQSLTFISKQIN